MQKQVIDLIEKYDRIIIHRHTNPDGDAMGTQLGLKRVLNLTYPNKEVYAVGDTNVFTFLGEMDEIEDALYNDALVIVVDVCVDRLISDERYKLGKQILVLDHHLNEPDFECISYIDSNTIACAEMVATILKDYNMVFDELAATRFLTGIVTDSGRFLYPSTKPHTLEMASYLMKQGANLKWVYEKLYTEELNFKKLKGHFINNFKVYEDMIAYMKNDKNVKHAYNVSTFTVSRAMVNQMSGIKGIEAWANFTEKDDGSILVELRSKEKSIVDVARKYGGGGHALACGCTLDKMATTNNLLEDLHNHLTKGV